jgi:hypothetical protein
VARFEPEFGARARGKPSELALAGLSQRLQQTLLQNIWVRSVHGAFELIARNAAAAFGESRIASSLGSSLIPEFQPVRRAVGIVVLQEELDVLVEQFEALIGSQRFAASWNECAAEHQ